MNENKPFLSFSQVLDLWFEQVAREIKYNVRDFTTQLIEWHLWDYLEKTVFDEIVAHVFPQLVQQAVNRIIDLDIDKTNYAVTYEQGRLFNCFLANSFF